MTEGTGSMPESDQPNESRRKESAVAPPVVVERVEWNGAYENEVSLVSLLTVLLRERSVVLLSITAAVALAVVLTVLQPRQYRAAGSFVPQVGETSQFSGLAGVAAQFGVRVPSGEAAGRSPEFYADLVRSRWLLSRVAESKLWIPDDGADSVEVTLPEILEVEAPSKAERRAAAIRVLEKWISVNTDAETGLVRLSVTSPSAWVSEQVGRRILNLVNEFNVEVRQSQAAAERRFVEDRLAEARDELNAAEEALETFLERNRRYENSPQLRFEHQRLQRRVDLRQQVYTSLAQGLEQARIQEVKSTPVITVVDPVERPIRPVSSKLVRNSVLALILGGLVGVMIAFLREFQRSASEEDSEEYREFELLKQETVRDFRDTWRKAKGLLKFS